MNLSFVPRMLAGALILSLAGFATLAMAADAVTIPPAATQAPAVKGAAKTANKSHASARMAFGRKQKQDACLKAHPNDHAAYKDCMNTKKQAKP